MGSSRVFSKRFHSDTLYVVLFAIFAGIISTYYEIFETLSAFAAAHEEWELDEVFSVLIITSLALIVLSYLRGRRLQAEIELREASEELASTMARHDPLTGLPNRRLLQEKFSQAQSSAQAHGKVLAVLLIDLDNFKPVNDLYGHAAGDFVLTQISRRLQELAETIDGSMLARLGGDEFAWVLEYEAGTDAPVRLANQIVHLARTPVDILGAIDALGIRDVQIGASVGIATTTGTNLEMGEFLRMADIAMYRAKRDGRATFRSFENTMDTEIQTQAALQIELSIGIERQELIPYYQPVLSLPAIELIGFEILARWNHPERGFLTPDVFIPIAEDSRLINDLTLSLLRRACADAREWPRHLTLSLNISPVQLLDPRFPERLIRFLNECDFSPDRLIVELTESAIIQDMDLCRSTIASLKNVGIGVSLDDFGTGYSSLSHLRELQFDSIKIDRSFVRDMDSSHHSKLVEAIIGMGHSLGMTVTAEGVETESDLSTLVDLHCDGAQGFLFGEPTSADGARGFLSLLQAGDD